MDTPDNARIVLPPHGFISLQSCCASDLDVVNAARVSFSKKSELDEDGKLKPEDVGVLKFLMRERHGTPFEHNFFKFHIRAPIFVMREWHRHRIGVSINEESGRYTELATDSWIPAGKEVRTRVGKPGNYQYEAVDLETAKRAEAGIKRVHDAAFEEYERLLDDGVANEVARNVLPVGTYSQMIWSCNARSLMSFISLRSAPEAQREIRLYSEALESVLETQMPITYEAFVENGKVSP